MEKCGNKGSIIKIILYLCKCIYQESSLCELMMSKISLRFYKDRQVRAIWDDEHSKWWFSAIDIIRAINEEPDYVKAGNYWRWLKKKFKKRRYSTRERHSRVEI